MILFLDSSALVQYYVNQIGTKKVQELLARASEIYISSVTRLECLRAFRRLAFEKAISEPDYEQVKSVFVRHFQDFLPLPFDKLLEDHAATLIEKYGLKTLDSIQLASAVHIKDTIGKFVSSDVRLIRSVREEGIEVINPNED